MNALFLRDHGQPRYAVLQGAMREPGAPVAGQILLRAHAAGVSQTDLNTFQTPVQMDMAPTVPGREVAGEVLAVGDGVTAFAPGDRVAALTPASAWAEKVLVQASCAALLPDNVSFTEGSVLLSALVLALDAIKAAKLQTGERIVVAGATTAVGSVIVQLTKRMANAKVIAAVSGKADVAIAQKLRPELVVDRDVADVQAVLEHDLVRVAFDTTGVGHRLRHIVAAGGQIVQVGEVFSADKEKDYQRAERLAGLCRRGKIKAVTVELQAIAETIADAAKFMAEGVRAAHGPLFGVKEYIKALVTAEEGVASGRVVLLL